MRRFQLISGVMLCVLFSSSVGVTIAQDPELEQNGKASTAARNPTIIIVVEPNTSRPFNWKVRDKVSIGVRCISDDAVRVVGVGADIELVAVKVFENRVQMALRSPPAMYERLRKAAQISEYWFEVMAFREGHRETMHGEADLSQFLKDHEAYRPAGPDDWGHGARGDRLKPPTDEQLPAREWIEE